MLLQTAMVQVVRHHRLAKGLASDPGALELVEGLPKRLRHLRQLRVLVGIAVVELGWLELLVDPVESGGDRSREREVGISVGARNAILHPETRALAAEAEAAGAVVPARRDARGREGARLVALVGVDGRRVEVRELARHGHLPRQPLLEERRALPAAAREEIAAARLVPYRRVEMTGRARRPHVVLRHEGDGAALLPGDLLDPVLVEDVTVGHLERLRVAEVDIFLALSPL